MSLRPFNDDRSGQTPAVDKIIGNTYPTIKAVFESLQEIRYLAHNLTSLRPQEIEFQADPLTKMVQWRYVGTTEWFDLMSYNELIGVDVVELLEQVTEMHAEVYAKAEEVETNTVLTEGYKDQAEQAVIDASNASRLTVGSVDTGLPGSDVIVTIDGLAGAQQISFRIPAGDVGPVNELGIGTVVNGADAAATITGVYPNQKLNLVLPEGEDGVDGLTPEFEIGSVTTGEPGTAVEVTVTGTAPNFTLNFVIPRGDPGSGGGDGGDMLKSENLAGLYDTAIARTNLGLGNVNNTSDAGKPVSTAQATALATKVDKVVGYGLSKNDFTDDEKTKLGTISNGATANQTDAYLLERGNHTGTQEISTVVGLQDELDSKLESADLTKAAVGLGNVDNTSDADKPVSTAQQTALNAKVNSADLNKSAVGLGNVDNTSDADKPISTATQTALNGKASPTAQQLWTVPQLTSPGTNNTLTFDLAVKRDFVSTPTVAGTLTFQTINALGGQLATITLINTAGVAIAKASHVKCPAGMLARISQPGRYRLSISAMDGTNVDVTSSEALA